MEQQLNEIIKQVYHKNNKNLFTFLTGAGISADSGIPTYRGIDGIWVKGTKFHKPEEFGTYKYFKGQPEEVWQYSLFRKKMFENTEPNESHQKYPDGNIFIDSSPLVIYGEK